MSEDSNLQEAVLSELSWEPSVTCAHIGVMAKGGVVTLTGHVESFAEKQAAEVAACRVKGVRAVAEEIEVRLPASTVRGDDEIAAAAIAQLAWDISVPQNSIKVKVEDGWVTLAGEVDWYFQKSAAEQDIQRLFGVRGVSNNVSIKPKIDTHGLEDDITHALHRSWMFDPKQVTVSAYGGKIRLAGTVHTAFDRQVAGSTAWAARGATDVENDIVVG